MFSFWFTIVPYHRLYKKIQKNVDSGQVTDRARRRNNFFQSVLFCNFFKKNSLLLCWNVEAPRHAVATFFFTLQEAHSLILEIIYFPEKFRILEIIRFQEKFLVLEITHFPEKFRILEIIRFPEKFLILEITHFTEKFRILEIIRFPKSSLF